MRCFVAMFSHETNTFSTLPTGRAEFEARDWRHGAELLDAYRGTGTCLGGMIEVAEARGIALVPSVAAAASPAGRVTRAVYEEVTGRLLADLRAAGAVDAVLLALHGAMVPEHLDDGEGPLLGAVREIVGPGTPVGVTLDLHANLSEAMVRHATLLHGFRTYPHVDMAERGREAAERALDVLAGRVRPAVACRRPPLLPPISGQRTAEDPMRRLCEAAAAMERDGRAVTVSVFAGFPLADVPDAGLSVYVATHDDPPLAGRLADELVALAWERRREFLRAALPVPEAVARALALPGRPVVLADIADNVGGGATGDGTAILRELLRVGARDATVACLWDPEAVAACVRAGVGATVSLRVGARVDDRHGEPVEVTGRVRLLGDGRFVHRGPMFRGTEGRLGTTAVLESGGVRIILTSLRWQTFDPEMIRAAGIDPTAEKILVVKSSVHYRAAFEPIAHAIIEVDAPGLSSSNLDRFEFRRLRRPIFPLDEV